MNLNSVQYLLGTHRVPGVGRSWGYKDQSPVFKDLSPGRGTGRQWGLGKEKLAPWGFHPQGTLEHSRQREPRRGPPLQDAGTVLPPRSATDTKSQCIQLKLVRGTRIPQTEDTLMRVVEGGLTAQSSVGRQRPRPQQRVTFTGITKVIHCYLQCNTMKRPGDV